jgi:HEAT repeat protein
MFSTDSIRSRTKTIAACCLAMSLVFGLALTAMAVTDEEVEFRMQKAREALNESRFEQAAELFSQIYEERSANIEAGDALYWEAFARYRLDKTSQLRRAARLLALQQEKYSEAVMALEGEALAARINGELAERGEAMAAMTITGQANEEDLRQETRLAALQSLMRMDRSKAMPVLKKIVRDDSKKNRELRRNAVFIMCHDDDEETEDLLIELLKKETDPEFQSELVMCLSSSGSSRALDAMLELYRSTNSSQVSVMILSSIGHFGGDRAYDFLLDVARDRDGDAEARGYALHGLSMTDREDEVTDVVVEILAEESEPEILEMALSALHRVDNPRANQALLDIVGREDVDEDIRAYALHFAAANDVIDIRLLRTIYDGTDSREMKVQVCHILTQMDQEDAALDMLIDIARNERDSEIRRDAVFWIGQFENDRAAEYLLEVINQE